MVSSGIVYDLNKYGVTVTENDGSFWTINCPNRSYILPLKGSTLTLLIACASDVLLYLGPSISCKYPILNRKIAVMIYSAILIARLRSKLAKSLLPSDNILVFIVIHFEINSSV